MGHIYPPAFVIDGFHNGHNGHPGRQPLRRVGDTGHGNAVHGEKGYDTAPDIHKGAKGLQMGDPGRENIPRPSVQHPLPHTFFLGRTAGQIGHWLPFLRFNTQDLEADRLAHPCDDGDVLRFAPVVAVCRFFPFNDSRTFPQIHPQGHIPAIAYAGDPLQDPSLRHSPLQPLQRGGVHPVFLRADPHSLGTVSLFRHFSSPLFSVSGNSDMLYLMRLSPPL